MSVFTNWSNLVKCAVKTVVHGCGVIISIALNAAKRMVKTQRLRLQVQRPAFTNLSLKSLRNPVRQANKAALDLDQQDNGGNLHSAPHGDRATLQPVQSQPVNEGRHILTIMRLDGQNCYLIRLPR